MGLSYGPKSSVCFISRDQEAPKGKTNSQVDSVGP